MHAIEEELQSSLDSSTALKLLPQIRDLNLHALMRASEERVAADFERLGTVREQLVASCDCWMDLFAVKGAGCSWSKGTAAKKCMAPG